MESETLNAEIDRLLFRIKAGDADAFCSFVDATKRPLALSALAYLKNADDIEDALQETYISILVHIDGYCSAQNPMGWVYKIFKNKCLSILRNRRSDLPLDFAADIGAAFCFEHTDNMLLVQTLMNNLTQKEIKVVSMKLWLDMTFEEIASAARISKAAAHRTYARALKKWRAAVLSKKVSAPRQKRLATEGNKHEKYF